MSWETRLLTGVLVVLIAVVLLTAGVALYFTVNPPQESATASQTLRLTFVAERDGNPEIYVMDGDGRNVQRLTENTASDTSPAWSPDGTQIAFLRFAEEPGQRVPPEENGLYLVNADGSDEIQLAQISSTMTVGPAWSPDGTQIAYGVSDETQTDGGRHSIYVVSRQDGEPTAVLTSTYSVYNLAWSPDETYLLFTSGGEDAFPRVSAFDLASGVVTELGNPAWVAACSPTGEEVAYFSFADSRFHVVRLSGGADRPLNDRMRSGYRRIATDLVWSPDGEMLFYAVWDDTTQRSEFYSLNVEGGQASLITDVEGQVWGMALSPDGQSLVYSLIIATEQGDEGLPPSAIYRLDVHSRQISVLSEETGFSGMASWSPR